MPDSHFILNRKWYCPGSGKPALTSFNFIPCPASCISKWHWPGSCLMPSKYNATVDNPLASDVCVLHGPLQTHSDVLVHHCHLHFVIHTLFMSTNKSYFFPAWHPIVCKNASHRMALLTSASHFCHKCHHYFHKPNSKSTGRILASMSVLKTNKIRAKPSWCTCFPLVLWIFATNW